MSDKQNIEMPFPSVMEKCTCSGHMIEVQYDTEIRQFYVALWQYRNDGGPLSWRQRLRWMWRIFLTGHPWADSVCLNVESARSVANFLNKYSESYESSIEEPRESNQTQTQK